MAVGVAEPCHCCPWWPRTAELSSAFSKTRELPHFLCHCKAVATCEAEEAAQFLCSIPGACTGCSWLSRGTCVCPKSLLKES